VIADRVSKEYKIQRGTKQGDPLSPKLFNAVLEKVLESIQADWRRKGFGIAIGAGPEDRLCNLRFADDIILLATSRSQLKQMLGDLSAAAITVGLELHMGKTKVLNNSGASGSVEVQGSSIDIVDTTEYLGRYLSFDEMHTVEVDSRISKAWKKFMVLKGELCSRHYPLKHRLKLFDSTVTAVVLYGSGTWTMTAELQRKLQTTQRRMLRWMIGVGRLRKKREVAEDESDSGDESATDESGSLHDERDEGDDSEVEDWVEWIKRATRIAEYHLEKVRLEDWVTGQRRRKFRWAGHVARRSDGRWSYRLLDWQPREGHRTAGRPKRRWADNIDNYVMEHVGLDKGAWIALAQDRDAWKALENDFVNEAW
jgi:hypothetical protein